MVFRAAYSTHLCSRVRSISCTWEMSLTGLDSFNIVQDKYPDLIAIDSTGSITGNVADFCESPLHSLYK
jgi:hypothetical protein